MGLGHQHDGGVAPAPLTGPSRSKRAEATMPQPAGAGHKVAPRGAESKKPQGVHTDSTWGLEKMAGDTYSPTGCPLQYHRRARA
jgi:hypothetical protein